MEGGSRAEGSRLEGNMADGRRMVEEREKG